ncbi:MAG: CAP domain-containing protein [Patescibacteria group bacterium]
MFLKILLGLALLFAVLIFGGFLINEKLSEVSVIELPEVVEFPKAEDAALSEKPLSPPPLEVVKKPEDVPAVSILTREGIVSWTNFLRASESLNALDADPELDKIAETKLNDMLARQYFEHVSPAGDGISDVAKSAGYKLVLIGENLAMGDFKDDEDVVRAWMASPGHRANILRSGYSKIGVAAKKDFLKGRLVWVAVQIFSIPLSVCQSPDPGFVPKIEANKNQLESLKSHLDLLRDVIENEKYETREQYESMVNEHNSLVGVYNSLSKETKNLIQDYNAQVETFNKCVDSFDTT